MPPLNCDGAPPSFDFQLSTFDRLILTPVLNKPIVLAGVIGYSLLVAALRWYRVIGDRGAYILFAVMVLDLAATHWLIRRRSRERGP